VASRRTELVKEGVLCGRLHSRASAAAFGEEITGNMRAVDYRYNPIVRMSNIFIENGETSFDDLVAQCEDGLYLIGAKGGQSIGDLFSFGAQYGYKIEKGKITGLVRDINMSGNLFTTMKAILAVGNDFRLNESAGCGKGSVGPMQMMWASGHGGPHTLLEDIVIGGV
jgi:TldD protein